MKQIGAILVASGMITPEILKKAINQQSQEPDRFLGEILIEMGGISEEDVALALATQANVPYLPLSNTAINSSLDELIPKELVQKYLCLPLERIANLLTVVMADPTDEEAITHIEKVTQCKVQPFVGIASEINAAIEQSFHKQAPSIAELKNNFSDQLKSDQKLNSNASNHPSS